MIKIPPINGQRAIAAVLADMDAEIAALEVRHEKVRQFKQGLMQSLLNGRGRLVSPSDPEPVSPNLSSRSATA